MSKSSRSTYPITENWYIYKGDESKLGYNPNEGEPTAIPSIIQEVFPLHHGVAFYRTTFTPDIDKFDGGKLLLRFYAVDYKAEVWLNDEYLGSHEGGETPFEFDVTNKVNDGDNTLLVRVINPINKDIDGLNIMNVPSRNKRVDNTAGSSMNHGGIWDSVELVSVPGVYIDDMLLTGDVHTGELTADLSLMNASEAKEGSVTINVYARYSTGEKVTGIVAPFKADNGANKVAVKLVVPDITLWDIDNPYLYYVEITVETEMGRHTKIERFGFREFLVKDGYFMLNGRKIFLKGSHSGNAFPIGQGYPVVKEQIRQDMLMAKTYGFNMIRGIAGVFRKEQLEVCDEIGLLVYEESHAAWCTGRKHGPKAQELEIGDLDLMLQRFDNCTLEMINRDKNHPSVVMWGFLNETFEYEHVSDRARALLPRAREVDPSRLIMFSSGRWDKACDKGSASNPYSDTWDVMMGADGAEGFVPNEDAVMHIDGAGDFHCYPQYPFEERFYTYMRNYAKDYLPAFISECGMGPSFNVIEEAKHFEQYGCRRDLDDYMWIKDQANRLEADWKRLGLERVYPTAEMMLKESQRLSAEDRRRIFDVIRSNPKFNGYSLSGLLDHGWCGEGLWSLWRRFKPGVYDAVCDGWAALRFCLFTKHHVYSGEEFEVEAVLANECVLKPGKYTAEFSIVGDNGTVEMWNEDFEIKDDAFAVPVTKKKIKLDVASGMYSLIAYMKDASPLGNKFDFYVTNKNETPKSNAKIYAFGLDGATVEFLKGNGVEVSAFDGGYDRPIIVGKNIAKDDVKALKDAADKGAKVFFANYDLFEDGNLPIPGLEEVVLKTNGEWFYHKENVMANRQVFKGLGSGLVDQKIFGATISKKCFETTLTPDDVISPAFYTGYYGYVGSYQCAQSIAGFNSGKGMIYINTYRMEEVLDTEPAAGTLLLNIVNYLA